MSPYLLEIQAKTCLSLGKSIVQILSAHGPSTYPVLRWLSMDQGEEKAIALLYHEVEDEGEEGYFDPADFTPLDEEEPYGLQTEFDTVEQAFAFAAHRCMCADGHASSSPAAATTPGTSAAGCVGAAAAP